MAWVVNCSGSLISTSWARPRIPIEFVVLLGDDTVSKNAQDDDSSEEQPGSEAVIVSKKAVPRLEGFDEMSTEFDHVAIPGRQHVP